MPQPVSVNEKARTFSPHPTQQNTQTDTDWCILAGRQKMEHAQKKHETSNVCFKDFRHASVGSFKCNIQTNSGRKIRRQTEATRCSAIDVVAKFALDHHCQQVSQQYAGSPYGDSCKSVKPQALTSPKHLFHLVQPPDFYFIFLLTCPVVLTPFITNTEKYKTYS